MKEHGLTRLKARKTEPFDLAHDELPANTAMQNPFRHVMYGAKPAGYRASNHFKPGNTYHKEARQPRRTRTLNLSTRRVTRQSFDERAATVIKPK